MNKKIIFLMMLYCQAIFSQASITFIIPHGRLGNVIIALAKAKYLADNYKLKLRIPQFAYADQFLFFNNDSIFGNDKAQNYPTIRFISERSQITDVQNPKMLYISNFNFPLNLPRLAKKHLSFKKALQNLLKPKNHIELPYMSHDMLHEKIIVGIHIRTGGMRDKPEVISHLVHKFPPIKFYTKALKILVRQIRRSKPQKKIHVHIFTDDSHPEKLVSIFQKATHKRKLSYSYRKTGNAHNAYVIEDLFAMAHTDYLIRPHSTYSIVAELIGNHKKVIPIS